MRALCAVGVLLAGCVSPVMTFGEGKTAKQAQHDTMSELGPARLATGETWKGEVATKKVRVWADAQYRSQNLSWQATFEEPLELANVVVTPLFGIRLVAEYAIWDRNEPGATLGDSIEALRAHDPGEDVFCVIGLTSSLPLVSATFDELGLAMINGRHMMLRGYADLAERKLYADAFPDLRPEERELALVHLRHHKTAVVLLHELGHVLGVEHEGESTLIMNAAYSRQATQFSPAARGVMLANVDGRLGRTPSAGAAQLPVATATPMPVRPTPASAPVPALAPGSTSATPPSTTRHAPVTIRITRKAATIVDGKTLAADQLDALVRTVLAEDPRTRFIVAEDRNLPTGTTGDLVDRLKALGVQKFELAWSGK